jgi:uncharacterized repeat protein (TIGR03803 family)
MLYTFCKKRGCPDGESPNNLVQAADGNLYGTRQLGGSACPYNLLGCGTAVQDYVGRRFYDVARVLRRRAVVSLRRQSPGGLVVASDGNLYGSASTGGSKGQGAVFRMTTDGKLSTIHEALVITLMQDTDGDFYGTAGGIPNCATIFRLSAGLPPFVSTLPAAAHVGSTVKILGTMLTGSIALAFVGTAAAFKVVSPSEITATVPSDASSGMVEVTL